MYSRRANLGNDILDSPTAGWCIVTRAAEASAISEASISGGIEMPWTEPEFNRGRVDAAGAVLVDTFRAGALDTDDDYESLYVVNNWRLSHQLPLQTLKMNLLTRSRKLDKEALVYQRIKRLWSIVGKLDRNENMKLSQMQDIGGCRSVVRSVKQVNDLIKIYEERPTQSEFVKKYDYISRPKSDGYRSVHLVYKYRGYRSALDGLRVEIQVRSRQQHAWASAVETVSQFTGQALKSNIGLEPWKRFFILMANDIAAREHCPPVPDSVDPARQKEELRSLVRQLRVEEVLGEWRNAVTNLTTNRRSTQIFVIALDLPNQEHSTSTAPSLSISGFDNINMAFKSLIRMEKERAGRIEAEQPVLVSVNSLAALRSAFPSYHLDAQAFIEAVRKAVA